jgi:hypothetical protein
MSASPFGPAHIAHDCTNDQIPSVIVLAAQVTGTQPAQMLAPVAGSAALWRGRRSSAASSRRHGGGSHHIDPTEEDALGAAAVTLAGADISISSSPGSSGRATGGINGSNAQHSSRSGDHSSREASGSGSGSRAAAETAAAMLSSLGTAFFEGPLEVFQHRAQVHLSTIVFAAVSCNSSSCSWPGRSVMTRCCQTCICPSSSTSVPDI